MKQNKINIQCIILFLLGIIWCMDHEDNAVSDDSETTPMLETKSEKPAQGPIFTGWSQSTKDIQTIIAANISGLQKQELAFVLNCISSCWEIVNLGSRSTNDGKNMIVYLFQSFNLLRITLITQILHAFIVCTSK